VYVYFPIFILLRTYCIFSSSIYVHVLFNLRPASLRFPVFSLYVSVFLSLGWKSLYFPIFVLLCVYCLLFYLCVCMSINLCFQIFSLYVSVFAWISQTCLYVSVFPVFILLCIYFPFFDLCVCILQSSVCLNFPALSVCFWISHFSFYYSSFYVSVFPKS